VAADPALAGPASAARAARADRAVHDLKARVAPVARDQVAPAKGATAVIAARQDAAVSVAMIVVQWNAATGPSLSRCRK